MMPFVKTSGHPKQDDLSSQNLTAQIYQLEAKGEV